MKTPNEHTSRHSQFGLMKWAVPDTPRMTAPKFDRSTLTLPFISRFVDRVDEAMLRLMFCAAKHIPLINGCVVITPELETQYEQWKKERQQMQEPIAGSYEQALSRANRPGSTLDIHQSLTTARNELIRALNDTQSTLELFENFPDDPLVCSRVNVAAAHANVATIQFARVIHNLKRK